MRLVQEQMAEAEEQEPVAIYRRRLPVSLERMVENALDWEHLPWLHSSSFENIRVLSADADHWRARSRLAGAGEETLLELRLHPDRMGWATRTLEGAGAGTLIDSRVVVHAEREIEVAVEFHVPGLATREQKEVVGSLYLELYEKLYDEDECMMVGRQMRLDERRAANREIDALGKLEDLRARLPLTVGTSRGPFRLVEVDQRIRIHSAICPHSLGPLEDPPCTEDNGVWRVRCPWHGYRFDLDTGASCEGKALKLAKPPELVVNDDGEVQLRWPKGE
jgi:nitrite reductase/ring-hydroxylating ferredoxin subunit